MLNFVRFLRMLRTSCFSMVFALFSLNAMSAYDDATCIGNSNGTIILPSNPTLTIENDNPVLGESIVNISTLLYNNPGSSTVLNEDGIIRCSGSTNCNFKSTGSTTPNTDEKIAVYMGDLEKYLENEQWSVDFDNGTISGYAACGAAGWTTDRQIKTGILSSTYNGCACALSNIFDTLPTNHKYVVVKYTFSGSNWIEKTNYCRQNCPYLCAQKVATDSQFRAKLYEIAGNECPIVQSASTTYTITYDLDGGMGCSNTTYTDTTDLCVPTRPGYSFDGYIETNTTDIYDGTETITQQNLTLQAQWTFVGCSNGYYFQNNTCNACESGFTSNGASATTEFDCYKTVSCPTPDCPEHAVNCAYVGETTYTLHYGESDTHCKTKTFDCDNGYAPKSSNCFDGIDTDINGNNTYGHSLDDQTNNASCYIDLSQRADNCNDYHLNDVEMDKWKTTFDYGTVYGSALCSSTTGEYWESGNPSSENGSNCWCKADSFTQNESSCTVSNTNWVLGDTEYVSYETCESHCVSTCGLSTRDYADFRAALFATNGGSATPDYCEIETYDIEFYLNDGTFPVTVVVPEKYTINDNITLPTPTRDGYTFNGWFANASFEGDTATAIPYGSTGDKTFYAKWTIITCDTGYYISNNVCVPEEYTITYVSNGGTEYEPTTYTIASNTITLPTPTRQNYEFNGWYDNQDFNGEPISSVVPGADSDHENKTFYAKWSEILLNAVFYCDANTAIEISQHSNSVNDGLTFPTNADLENADCPQLASYIIRGWTCVNTNDNLETVTFRNVQNAEWNADFRDIYCYPNWVENTPGADWECVNGIVEDNADDWSQDIKENLTSSRDLYTQGVVSYTSNNSYVISSDNQSGTAEEHLEKYLEGEEFFVTWGNTTIRGWGGCGPNTWNSRSDYSYTLQSLTYTNAGCGCSLDKENWAVKRNLLTVNGDEWFDKNEQCRANCPAACAYAVANDPDFRELLFNGQCPAPYVPQITCDPGYYLPSGATSCQQCIDADNYCTGGTFTPGNTDQGLTPCPQATNWPGAYKIEKRIETRDFSDIRNAIDQCAVAFYFASEDSLGEQNADDAYNADSEYNRGVVYQDSLCFYNNETQSYTDCLPTTMFFLFGTACEKGYKIKDSIANMDWPEWTGDNTDILKPFLTSHIGPLQNHCEIGEPGYYTKIYDTYKNSQNETSLHLYDKIGVAWLAGKYIDFAYNDDSTWGKEVQLSDLYGPCPSEYPDSAAGSWQKAHCYANVTYVFNDGSEDIVNKIHYSDEKSAGYTVDLPDVDTDDNYIFAGWYTTNDFSGEPVSEETVLSGNTTLYAKMTPASCYRGYYLDDTECVKCPDGFTSDADNNGDVTSCYKQDTVSCADLNPYSAEHVSGVIYGNSNNGSASCIRYYGDEECELEEALACIVTDVQCMDGYKKSFSSSLNTVNTSLDGKNYSYISNDGNTRYGNTNNMTNGTWSVAFDYGTITGTALCSNASTSDLNFGTLSGPSDHESCFCRINGFQTTNGENQSINSLYHSYGFLGRFIPGIRCPNSGNNSGPITIDPNIRPIDNGGLTPGNGSNIDCIETEPIYDSQCSEKCAKTCAENFTNDPDVRNQMISQLELPQCVLSEFECESGVWLHVGENAKACLSKTKTTSPSMVVEIRGEKYYLELSQSNIPVNEDFQTKMRIEYKGRTYNAHDASVSVE